MTRGLCRPRCYSRILGRAPDAPARLREEERRTLDLEVIQTDGEREARAQPASALGEADGDLDGDALLVELHRAGQDDPPRGVEGSFNPVAMPLTEQYGCSTT